jgi:hypothetical protein
MASKTTKMSDAAFLKRYLQAQRDAEWEAEREKARTEQREYARLRNWSRAERLTALLVVIAATFGAIGASLVTR